MGQGSGRGVFRALETALGDLPIIAEDLGVITEPVERLRDQFGLPGMKVLQFALQRPDQSFLAAQPSGQLHRIHGHA